MVLTISDRVSSAISSHLPSSRGTVDKRVGLTSRPVASQTVHRVSHRVPPDVQCSWPKRTTRSPECRYRAPQDQIGDDTRSAAPGSGTGKREGSTPGPHRKGLSLSLVATIARASSRSGVDVMRESARHADTSDEHR